MEKNSIVKTLKEKSFIADIVMLVGYLLLVAGIIMFLVCNDGIFFSTAAMAVIFSLVLLVLPVGYIVMRKRLINTKIMTCISIGLLLVSIIMLIIVILKSLIIDYVQPLSLNTANVILLIVASVILLVASLIQLLSERQIMSILVSSMMIMAMLTGIIWVNAQGYRDFNEDIIENNTFLFKNGEKDYATFRIPSIVALDHEIINAKYGYTLEHDLMIAMAEGRRDSSHDTGRIDLVYKTSTDLGKTWSDLRVMFTYGLDVVGKYGNPTPVLISETGELVVPYMTGTKENGYDYSTHIAKFTINSDMILKKISDKDISFAKTDSSSGGTDGVREHTLMVGPGKGIELKSGEHKGRLVIPASGGGHSYVMYSDDNGETWTKGESAGTGNECEVAELNNGELVMVVREDIGCTNLHPEQYQRLSYSKDGGKTWYRKTENTSLKSPICMSSIDTLSDGTLLMTYPNAFHTRVNLTFGISKDNGKTWNTKYIYNGAAGYSCMVVDSENNVFVLSEIGKVNYNEVLFFTKLNIA